MHIVPLTPGVCPHTEAFGYHSFNPVGKLQKISNGFIWQARYKYDKPETNNTECSLDLCVSFFCVLLGFFSPHVLFAIKATSETQICSCEKLNLKNSNLFPGGKTHPPLWGGWDCHELNCTYQQISWNPAWRFAQNKANWKDSSHNLYQTWHRDGRGSALSGVDLSNCINCRIASIPSVLSPSPLCQIARGLVQNKHVQQGQAAFTSLSHVPRVHSVLSFNPLREGCSALWSEGDSKEWKNEGGFFPKVTSERRITAVQHTAKPSAPEALEKLPLPLLKPTEHQGGRATFVPVEPVQTSHYSKHPLLWTPKALVLSPDLHSSSGNTSGQPSGAGGSLQHGVMKPSTS